MPELPEVETFRRQILPRLKGKQIIRVKILDNKVANFTKLNATIETIIRRGKLLIFKLKGDKDLLIHVKMSGRLMFMGPIEKSTRIIFYLSNKKYFVFNDVRKFGYAKLAADQEIPNDKFLKKLGPEPLLLKFEEFNEMLKQKLQAKIKVLLMTQEWIAGIGNIYAQEICFCAKVKPQRRVKALTKKERKRIFTCMQQILKKAIKKRGSSVDEGYRDAQGNPGTYDKVLKVYTRANKPCLRCKNIIKNVKLGGRGTRYCVKCQR